MRTSIALVFILPALSGGMTAIADGGTQGSAADPFMSAQTAQPTKPRSQFTIAPQASGSDYQNHKSLLDGQPMNGNVHTYNDPPKHPSIWQRWSANTKSMFSKAGSALSPKQKTVTDSRYAMGSQSDATSTLPSSKSQEHHSTLLRRTHPIGQ